MGLKGAVRMGAVDGLTVQRGAFRHSRSERAVTVTWGCNITGRTGFERLNASPTRPWGNCTAPRNILSSVMRTWSISRISHLPN